MRTGAKQGTNMPKIEYTEDKALGTMTQALVDTNITFVFVGWRTHCMGVPPAIIFWTANIFVIMGAVFYW